MEIIHLAQDELESLHLCDGEGMTQEEAGVCMAVSRGTVQRLLAAARRKVARAIVGQKALAISGNSPEINKGSAVAESVAKEQRRSALDSFQELRNVAQWQNEEGEFPDWLLTDIRAIVADPERYADKVQLVELLIAQIADFDPYAGAGCFASAVSAETIAATIRQIVAVSAGHE